MAHAHLQDHLLPHQRREGGATRKFDACFGCIRGERYRLVGEQTRRRVR